MLSYFYLIGYKVNQGFSQAPKEKLVPQPRENLVPQRSSFPRGATTGRAADSAQLCSSAVSSHPLAHSRHGPEAPLCDAPEPLPLVFAHARALHKGPPGRRTGARVVVVAWASLSVHSSPVPASRQPCLSKVVFP
ncbi:hypothetical protein G6O67_005827 [Ophiocordyceps sinensis]|uniref:Uncharacterized protein n=1 Tax=Ophiocordyceps sinensis TaxID=72228 RepID=A0A8H4PPB4_9HYPO|nr:hypothetical protein G6O67_005827 [Ophiocordyceps sinensis]